MTALAAYRDDGALAQWLAGRLAGRSPAPGRSLAWTAPPVLRLAEYGLLIGLTTASGSGALPRCFALLFVLAFHHYDNVLRVSYQGAPPPRWLLAVGGGWEGRIVAAAVLTAAGALGPGLLAGAIALGVLFVGESTASWIRFARSPGVARVSEDAFE
jgi:hypothetical protein